MSNEYPNLDPENILSESDLTKDIFVGLDVDAPLERDTVNEILGVKEEEPVTKSSVPKWVPPSKRTQEAEKISKEVKEQMTPEKEKQTQEARIKALEDMLSKLQEDRDGVRVVSTPQRPIKLDFSQLSEDSVYDLSVPIEAIDHVYPDFSKIDLADQNYIGRWININPMRMGTMKTAGFTYVTPEDLATPMEQDLKLDENGVFRWHDVIAMKAPKSKYFAALRANHLRAIAQTNPKKVHELARQVTENSIMQGTTETKAPLGQAREYLKQKEAGHMGIYSPNL